MEKIHTYYGLFLEDGSRTEAVDVMTHLWSGRWPTNLCPKLISAIRLSTPAGKTVADAGSIAAGTMLRCAVEISDLDGDTLTVEWDLRRDVADDPRVGGDYEPLQPVIANAVVESVKGQAPIQLPAQPAKYRVFVYARDGRGGAAAANVPIQTKQQQP